jgi:hypothetical protein
LGIGVELGLRSSPEAIELTMFWEAFILVVVVMLVGLL